MHFSAACIISAAPLLAIATPVNEGVEARSVSTTGIPLSKRSALHNLDGTVITKMLQTSVSHSVSYVLHL